MTNTESIDDKIILYERIGGAIDKSIKEGKYVTANLLISALSEDAEKEPAYAFLAATVAERIYGNEQMPDKTKEIYENIINAYKNLAQSYFNGGQQNE